MLSLTPLLLFQHWPSLLSFCVSHHGWLEHTAASLPPAKPDAPWHDFWCCHFQVDMEITSNVLALSQPVTARKTKVALRKTLSFVVHKAVISWDGTREKKNSVC